MTPVIKNQKTISFIVIAVAVLYGALWYGYAVYFKTSLIQAMNSESISLKYDSADIGGFPLAIKVTFQNPSIHSKTGKIVDNYLSGIDPSTFKQLPIEQLRAAIDKNWEDHVSYEQLMVEANLLATRYKVTHSGKMISKTVIDGESFAFASYTADPIFTVQFAQSPLFIKDSPDNLLAILSSVTSIRFSIGQGKSLKYGTEEVVSSSDGTHFMFDLARLDYDRHRLEVKLNSKNAELTKLSEDMFARLLKLPSFLKIMVIPEIRKNVDPRDFVGLWRRGKSNSDFHIIYTGTTNKEVFARQDAAFNLEILKLESSDDFGHTKTEGRLAFTANKQAMNGSLVLHGAATMNQKWYDYKLEKAKIAQANKAGDYSSVPMSEKISIPVLIRHMDKIIPKLQDYGTIKYDVDMGFDREKQALDVKRLDVVTDLYGTKIAGNKDASNKITLNINLVNFRRLVDDLVDYYQKVRPIIDEAAVKPLEFTVAPEMRDALKLFLIKISDTPANAGDNINVAIKLDKAAMPTIGTLNMQQAAQLVQTSLVPMIVMKKTDPITPQKP